MIRIFSDLADDWRQRDDRLKPWLMKSRRRVQKTQPFFS